jgi:hypothetical protein
MQSKRVKTLHLRICQERIMHIWMVKMAYEHAHKRKSNLCGEDKRKRKGSNPHNNFFHLNCLI